MFFPVYMPNNCDLLVVAVMYSVDHCHEEISCTACVTSVDVDSHVQEFKLRQLNSKIVLWPLGIGESSSKSACVVRNQKNHINSFFVLLYDSYMTCSGDDVC